MKKQLNILFLFLVFGLPISKAQVADHERSMSQGSQTAYTINILDTNEKFVSSIWKKYLKSFKGKSKKNRGTEEIFTEGAKISSLGRGERVNLYTIFEQTGDDVSLSMWVDLGGEFLSPQHDANRVEGAKNFLEDFASEVDREIIRLQIKEEEEKLEKLEVNLKRLKKDKAKYEREIESAEEKIQKNKEKIEDNEVAQEEMLQNIKEQTKVLSSVKALKNR